MTLANAHFFAAKLHCYRGEAGKTGEHCQAVLRVSGEQGIALYAPVIVKYRDARTDAAAALEDALR